MRQRAGEKIGYQLMEWNGSAWFPSQSRTAPMDIVPAVAELDANRARYPDVLFCLARLTIAVIDHAEIPA